MFPDRSVLGRAAFRHDVHALRALASAFVLVFHINPDMLPGGFTGVDLFYVISGFVIFRGLFADERHRGVVAFYRRRIFRILPNIVATAILTFAAGVVMLTPGELSNLGGSVLASLFSVSNFYFADRLGYFAPAVVTTPLIHFWSLAVEEQFYILTPLLLGLFAWCGSTRRIVYAILVIIGLSFAVNCLMVYGLGDTVKSFYYPFTRFWEIGLGVLLAAVEPYIRFPPAISRPAIGLGTMGLVASAVLVTEEVPFPGVPALLPTLSVTLFIIAAADSGAATTRVFRLPPISFLGDLSYALYIVHWPIIAFWNMLYGAEKNWLSQLLLLVLCVLAAFAMRQLVELPFIRFGRRSNAVRPALGLVGCMTTLAFVAAASVLTDGFPIRLNTEARDLVARMNVEVEHTTSCFDGVSLSYLTNASRFSRCGPPTAPRYLLAGDSHAGMISTALANHLAEKDHSGFVTTLPDCQMLFGTMTAKKKNRAACAKLHDDIVTLVRREKIDVVILASRWANITSPVRAPFDGGKPKGLYAAASGAPMSFEDALGQTITAIREAGADVVIISPVPELTFDAPSAVLRQAQLGVPVPRMLRTDVDLRQSFVMPGILNAGKMDRVAVINSDDIFCDTVTCSYTREGVPLYIDSNHLNPIGAELLAVPTAAAVEKILDERSAM